VYRVHMIIKHFHLHFMENRIFNNTLYFLSFLFFLSLSLFPFTSKEKTRNLGSMIIKQNKKNILQSKSTILFFFFSYVRLYLTVHLSLFSLITQKKHTNEFEKCSNLLVFTLPIHIHLFFCTKYDKGKKTFTLFSLSFFLLSLLINVLSFFLLMVDQH